MKSRLKPCLIIRLFLIFIVSSSCAKPVAHTVEQKLTNKHVTVLGLGDMGKAIVKCYSKHGYIVHAWNRSEKNRQIVQDLHLPGVHVYDDLSAALLAKTEEFSDSNNNNIVLMNIDAGSHLSIPQSLITKQTDGAALWENKILVQFSSHTPTDAVAHQELISSFKGHLVAGALVAVPETICSTSATILVSSSDNDEINESKSTSSLALLEETQGTLEHLGNLVQFTENVGLASLANMAIIQALTFGVAGHEMAHLIMEQYGVSDEFRSKYLELVTTVITSYVPMLYGVVSKSISTKLYQQYSYVPSKDFLRLLEMHQTFIVNDMNIAPDTYLEGYIRYLRKVADPLGSPSAWVDSAMVTSPNDNTTRDSNTHDATYDEDTNKATDTTTTIDEIVTSEL
mmetsp:Transcript_13286/g.18821  ORF Transcript_13286/g.18821 Transcript_13286/m.18821 type:complete len:398 (-) Transcript_13286:298-1491(-)